MTALDATAFTRRTITIVTYPSDARYSPLRLAGKEESGATSSPSGFAPGTVRVLVYSLDALPAVPAVAAVVSCGGPGSPELAKVPLALQEQQRNRLFFEGAVVVEESDLASCHDDQQDKNAWLQVEVDSGGEGLAAREVDSSAAQLVRLSADGSPGRLSVVPFEKPIELRTTWLETFALRVDFTVLITWYEELEEKEKYLTVSSMIVHGVDVIIQLGFVCQPPYVAGFLPWHGWASSLDSWWYHVYWYGGTVWTRE